MKTVKMKGQAITAVYGTLNTDDTRELPDDFAAHLVDDLAVAEYVVKTTKPALVDEPGASKAKAKGK